MPRKFSINKKDGKIFFKQSLKQRFIKIWLDELTNSPLVDNAVELIPIPFEEFFSRNHDKKWMKSFCKKIYKICSHPSKYGQKLHSLAEKLMYNMFIVLLEKELLNWNSVMFPKCSRRVKRKNEQASVSLKYKFYKFYIMPDIGVVRLMM